MAPQKTMEQCKIFLQFMEIYPDIARGMYKGDRVKLDKLWSELSDKLNASGPPTRNITNWKKIWCDWRRSIKTRLAENKMSLKKTGGGDYQQHFLTPVEEQLAVICNIFHAVEGISEAKSFGAEPTKSIELEDDVETESVKDGAILIEKPTSSALPAYNTEMSPLTKKPRFSGDIQHLMEEEAKNFKYVAGQMEEINNNIQEQATHLRKIYKGIDEICSLKKEDILETKRHHQEMEKVGISRNELMLEFLKLEKMKMGMED